MNAQNQMVPTSRESLHPLFRWPGGKRWLVPRLIELVPDSYGRYFEPFLGGGALFFALRPARAVLADKNGDLINAYQWIRDDHARVGSLLRAMPRTEADYYHIRALRPTDDCERAARTIYLTTLAFNGIHRVNLAGDFNVPFGHRSYPQLGADAILLSYSEALHAAELEAGDFEVSLRNAQCGDLVYLDPPYTVAHSNNGFLKYNARIFSSRDQERLAALAASLLDRGCHVIVTNADHKSIQDLYPAFERIDIHRRSVMASSGKHRKEVTESLFRSPSKGP